ncbi:hypothetical protein KJ359_007707 [Pestalotiopsis sp. 9143b]|nr:hypothetical protein KJ359_007707 [Pestalotiopsis sp. 9143b]
MDFQEMQETDYYSYGLVVLSIMISQPFHECLDMQDEKLHEMMLVKTKDLLSKVDKEKPDLDIDLSVTYDKANGNETVGLQSSGKARTSLISALNIAEMVTVGHATLSSTSHQLKEHIVERLLLVASNKDDPRHLAAGWELSICYFSGFGVDVNFEKCSHWLTVACEGGIVAAQHYFNVIHQAMAKPCPVMKSSGKRDVMMIDEIHPSLSVEIKDEETLKDGDDNSSSGSEDEEDRQIRAMPPRIMPQELIDIINEGTCEQLRSYIHLNPEHMNAQDAEGATPLVLAARLQRADLFEFLAKEPMTDASITTHAGQTVLHFLPSLDDELNIELVPLLVKRHASLHKEAFPAPLATGSTICYWRRLIRKTRNNRAEFAT